MTLLLPLCAILPADTDADRTLLEHAGFKVDGDGADLLAYLHRQAAYASDPAKLRQIIGRLGHDDFIVRERASAELVALGAVALPPLQAAVAEHKGKDAEVVHRAEQAIQRIREGNSAAVPAAVLRQLARKRPAGTAAQVLDYLAHAPEESTVEEATNTLTAVAVREGTADPVLLKAMRDPQPRRRAAAAEALSRARVAEARDDVRGLLKDKDIRVRLRVALALARLHDKEAIPVLIDSLAVAPFEQLLPVESLLFQIAGKDAPTVSAGTRDEERKKYRDAWLAWWKEHEASIDLAKAATAAKLLGYTLVVLLETNSVQELDERNQPRWSINDVKKPLDVQWLPGNRVLIAEYDGNVVTERNLKGEILWHRDVNQPLVAQRLPNGHTFIATEHALVEIDQTGKDVLTHTAHPGDPFARAMKLPNGDIACVTGGSKRFLRLDANGRTLKSFPVAVDTRGGRIDVLPNGHVLIPEKEHNRVVEYNSAGQEVWEVKVPQPVAAVRLPDGHTLVTSFSKSQGTVEFDRFRNQVWAYSNDKSNVTRALRR